MENLSAFFILFLWVLWLHQFWTMSSLVFPQGSSSSCHVKYLIHLNRLMFAKVEKMSQNSLLDRRLAHLAPGAHRKFHRLIYSFKEIIWQGGSGRFCASIALKKRSTFCFSLEKDRAVGSQLNCVGQDKKVPPVHYNRCMTVGAFLHPSGWNCGHSKA